VSIVTRVQARWQQMDGVHEIFAVVARVMSSPVRCDACQRPAKDGRRRVQRPTSLQLFSLCEMLTVSM